MEMPRASAAKAGGNTLKRIALLAVIGAGMLALPSTAAAQSSTCSGPVGTTPSGAICVDVLGAGGELVVNNSDGCSYVNGWETNPGSPGYGGICTGATSRGPNCSTTGTQGPNTGGCFEIKGAPAPVNQTLNTAP